MCSPPSNCDGMGETQYGLVGFLLQSKILTNWWNISQDLSLQLQLLQLRPHHLCLRCNNNRHVRSVISDAPIHMNITVSFYSPGYRVTHLLANHLGWIDSDLGCSTIQLGQ